MDRRGIHLRFIHTADWHLGRYFHGMHLTADQREIIMGQIVPFVREEGVEAVIIAGDIYDRGVPPVEAVDLFDEFLMKMAELRVVCDEAETVTAEKYWPFPTYERLLFGVR